DRKSTGTVAGQAVLLSGPDLALLDCGNGGAVSVLIPNAVVFEFQNDVDTAVVVSRPHGGGLADLSVLHLSTRTVSTVSTTFVANEAGALTAPFSFVTAPHVFPFHESPNVDGTADFVTVDTRTDQRSTVVADASTSLESMSADETEIVYAVGNTENL